MSHGTDSQGTVYKPADLAQHPYFKRTKQRKARWYCTLCGNANAHFDCAGATKHESSPRHVAALARVKPPAPDALQWENLNSWAVAPADAGWGTAPVEDWGASPVVDGWGAAPADDGWGPAPAKDAWGAPAADDLNGWGGAPVNDSWGAPPPPEKKRKARTPFQDLRTSEGQQVLECQDKARREWRIRMWMKELVLAAGGEWTASELDVEPPMPWNWDDEPRPDLAWGLVPAPGVEEDASERAMAVSAVPPSEGHVTNISSFSNFSHPHPWIERMAETFGWDAAATRDRNNFYTLPMKEKKARIQQMIYDQSPSHARAQRARHQPPQVQRKSQNRPRANGQAQSQGQPQAQPQKQNRRRRR
ncbi:hypothetical protein AURDEDRAFT_113607 [Auricularia subglabra TFB-10046 SS5]|nr:hypothetical protein AURDEDRAFT_113607 [Auricularia subglabra TFB-10046 SS5]